MRFLPILLLTCSLSWAQEPDLTELLKEDPLVSEGTADPAADAAAAAEAAAAAKAEEERKARAAAERQKAVGEEIELLTSKKGRTYNKAVITGIDDLGIKFRHEAGLARLKFEDLPTTMQTRFGFDPARAKAQQEEEMKATAERDRRIMESLRAREGAKEATRESSKSKSRSRSSRSKSDDDLSPEALAKIRGYEAKIRNLEAGIDKVQDEVSALRDRASKTRRDASYTVDVDMGNGRSRQETRSNPSKIRKAESYEKRADREYEKIETARDLIEKYEDAIEAVQRAAENK